MKPPHLPVHFAKLRRPACVLALAAFVTVVTAEPEARLLRHAAPATAPAAEMAASERDGQHDFDFLMGRWAIHLKKLVQPLSGSTTWQEFDGVAVARPLHGGRANIDQITVDSPTGRIEGLTLRMYNPQSRQWSIYWGNLRDGNLGHPVVPTVGSFRDGRGEFYDQELFQGRMIFIRYVWSEITPTSARFEQSFSADGGKTWEVNWITTQTRTGAAAEEEAAR